MKSPGWLPHIAFQSLLAGDDAGARAAVDHLDPADLSAITAAAVRLVDLAAPHHHCTACGKWVPKEDRIRDAQLQLAGLPAPMRCRACWNGHKPPCGGG